MSGNYCAFYVAEPFHEGALGAHATKDFVYYNTLRMWKGADSGFPLPIHTIQLITFVMAVTGSKL
jgi:sugar diacid utilization regulator